MSKNNKIPDSWCPLPWNHISIKSIGTFRICCHSHSSSSRGVIENDNILNAKDTYWSRIRNSEKLKDVRKKMLNGEWHEDCIRCKREFDSGMNSRNLYERLTFSHLTYDYCKEKTKEDGSIDENDFSLDYVDVRFGNLCNLKCVMCNPNDSNQWYDDYVEVFDSRYYTDTGIKVKLEYDKNKNRWIESTGIYDWYNDSLFWKEIEKYSDQLKKLYVVGGEPFLIDTHFEFLDYCIQKGFSKNIILEYNTNLTNIPQKAYEQWKKFKQVNFGVSIDGIGDMNNYIRYPSKFHQIEKNLKKLDKESDNFYVWITKSVSVFNIYHMPEFIEWIFSNNFNFVDKIEKNSGMSFHPVTRPFYYNVNIFSDNFKNKIKNKFIEYMNVWNKKNETKYKHAINRLNTFINYMNKIDFSEKELEQYRKKFIEVSDKLDKIRGTKWREIFPHLKEEFEE